MTTTKAKAKADVWLLALESSASKGGAALLRSGRTIEKIGLDEGLRHGRDLMPAAAAALGRAGLAPKDLDAVAVSVGPGSYTGLRVGVMAAKALAFALRIPVAGVSSLEALAESVRLHHEPEPETLLVIVQNARRDEVYLGSYLATPDGVEPVSPDRAVTPEEAAAWLETARGARRNHICAGTGFSRHPDVFGGAATLSPILHPDPEAVGRIGWRHFLQEETAGFMSLQPTYLRRDPDADWRHDALVADV